MKNQIEYIKDTNLTYLRLRALLGIFGFALPLLLLATNGFVLKPSISHYYYSTGGSIFVSFMFSFGIFLFSYKGRKKEEKQCISDNVITNFGGLMAMLTALLPTTYCSSGHCNPDLHFFCEISCLNDTSAMTLPYMHNIGWQGSFHLGFAGAFLVSMGFMAFLRFTKEETRNKKRLYRFCAVMIWLLVLFLIVEMLVGNHFTNYDVFIAECVALVFFGLAWFVKGRGLKKETWGFTLIPIRRSDING